MAVYSIGTAGALTQLTREVQAHFDPAKNISFSLERQSHEPFSFLICSVEPAKPGDIRDDLNQTVRLHLAEAIATAIFEEGLDWYLLGRIKKNYREIEPEARQQVISNAVFLLESPEGIKPDARQNWRAVITEEVSGFLRECVHINLRGFLLFRLGRFCRALDEAVQQAAEQYMMEREYREFVRLLRYFVETQDPREETVHVVIRPEGEFRIYDEYHVPIDRRYMGGHASELVEEGEYGDLLISALITISPRRITIHRGQGCEAVDTVAHVFEDRTVLCSGCDFCGDEDQSSGLSIGFLDME